MLLEDLAPVALAARALQFPWAVVVEEEGEEASVLQSPGEDHSQ